MASDPLSTQARRHVRLVREAWFADAKRAYALFGAKDHDGLFDYFHDTLVEIPPKKRRRFLLAASAKMAAIPGIPSCCIHLQKGVVALLTTLFPVLGHPFSFVDADTQAVMLLVKTGRRGTRTTTRPTAGLADHFIGRLFERGDLSVEDSVAALARLGYLSLEVAGRYKENDEVYAAITPELAAVGRIRIGIGDVGRGVMHGIGFVDWRTALDRSMVSEKNWAMAQDIGTWTLIKPGRVVKDARTARPDWIENHLMQLAGELTE